MMAEYKERESLFKRNNRMRWLYSEGTTHAELASLYDMSTRNACRITARAPPKMDRARILKELLPGLNALFGPEYSKYETEHNETYRKGECE